MYTCKKRSDRSNICIDGLLQGARAVQKHGRSITSAAKDSHIPLQTLARYCKKVRVGDMKSTSPRLLFNIQAKHRNPKMRATLTKKTPRILPASIVLVYPETCGLSAQTASCGHMNNALMAVPNLFAYIASLEGLEYFI
jgi:hypothetical protein